MSFRPSANRTKPVATVTADAQTDTQPAYPNRFMADDINKPRLVWDPEVHDFYGEQCIYALLRLTRSGSGIAQTLIHYLREAQITSFCVYVLYGYYDILIRMWITPRKRERFYYILAEDPTLLQTIDEFRVDSINYLWSSGMYSGDHVLHYADQIRIIATQSDENKILDENMLRDLVDAHLVHEIDPIKCLEQKGDDNTASGRTTVPETLESLPIKGDFFKFYIALSLIPGVPISPVLQEELQSFASKTNLCNVSMYQGIGFAQYMLKAVVKEYDQIYACVEALLEDERLRCLRPTTFLIADRSAKESDHIDINWNEPDGPLRQLEQLVGPRYAMAISQLSQTDREHVKRLMSMYGSLSDTNFDAILKGIFAAHLRRDTNILGQHMWFTVQLESLVLRFLLDFAISSLGSDWHRIVKEAAGKCGVDTKKEPKNYTLHDARTVFNKLITEGTLSKEGVEATLGVNWLQKLEALGPYRNAFAHGNIFADEKYVGEEWHKLAAAAFDVGQMYNKLSGHSSKKERI